VPGPDHRFPSSTPPRRPDCHLADSTVPHAGTPGHRPASQSWGNRTCPKGHARRRVERDPRPSAVDDGRGSSGAADHIRELLYIAAMGTFGSWAFIVAGAMLLILAPFNRDRPWVAW